MKVVFLHGLESSHINSKEAYLGSVFEEVFSPKVEYDGSFKNLFNEIKKFKPDCIIGSSAGGSLAFDISKKLNIHAILFNPAIDKYTLHKDPVEHLGNKVDIVLGHNDDVVPHENTVNYFKNKDNTTISILNHGHRTPIDIFIESVNKFL